MEIAQELCTSMNDEKKLVLTQEEVNELRAIQDQLDEFRYLCQNLLVRTNTVSLSYCRNYKMSSQLHEQSLSFNSPARSKDMSVLEQTAGKIAI